MRSWSTGNSPGSAPSRRVSRSGRSATRPDVTAGGKWPMTGEAALNGEGPGYLAAESRPTSSSPSHNEIYDTSHVLHQENVRADSRQRHLGRRPAATRVNGNGEHSRDRSKSRLSLSPLIGTATGSETRRRFIQEADGVRTARRAHQFPRCRSFRSEMSSACSTTSSSGGRSPARAPSAAAPRPPSAPRSGSASGRRSGRNPQPLAGLRGRQAISLKLLGLPQLGDGLLHAVALLSHAPPPIWLSNLAGPSYALDEVKGADIGEKSYLSPSPRTCTLCAKLSCTLPESLMPFGRASTAEATTPGLNAWSP